MLNVVVSFAKHGNDGNGSKKLLVNKLQQHNNFDTPFGKNSTLTEKNLILL
jgi:hypothetical protein